MIMVRTGLAGLALLMSAATATAETTRATVFESVSGAELAGVLARAGLKPTLSVDSYGDPLISVTSRGMVYEVQFYGCEAPEPRECETLMFSAGFGANGSRSSDEMNRWNPDRRFTRAYLNSAGDLRLEMDVVVGGGVSETMLHNQVTVWDEALAEFASHIGW